MCLHAAFYLSALLCPDCHPVELLRVISSVHSYVLAFAPLLRARYIGFLRLPLSLFRAPLKLFFNAFIFPIECAFFHKLSGLCVTSCVLPSGSSEVAFCVNPFIRLWAPREQRLGLTRPFPLLVIILRIFLWGQPPFPLAVVLVGWSIKVSCQEDGMLFPWNLDFESWDTRTDNDWRGFILAKVLWRSHFLVPASQTPAAALVPELSKAWFFRFSFVSVSYLISLRQMSLSLNFKLAGQFLLLFSLPVELLWLELARLNCSSSYIDSDMFFFSL